MVKKTRHGWPFIIAAALIMIFAMDIVWWQAILVAYLASFSIDVETRNSYRPDYRRKF